MASLVAISAPTACPTWSLKYGPVHFSGDSTTPSSETNSPAAIFRISFPFLVVLAAEEEPGQHGRDGLRLDHVVLAGQRAVPCVGQRVREGAGGVGHPGRALAAGGHQHRNL